jgi:ribosomal protein S18 acetylase RimI-like enzyme
MRREMEQLDNPVWHSLAGYHRHLAVGSDLARRYPSDISPFFGIPDHPTAENWRAAQVLADGDDVAIVHQDAELPEGWRETFSVNVVQMTASEPIGAPEPRARQLTQDDVPAMLRLIEQTKPGPFGARTILLGGYLGVWIDGQLAAMAGERLHVDGWTEVSAVATDPAFRGQGLGSGLVRAVAAQIEARGERAFLHVVDTNPARAIYENLGFRERRRVLVRGVSYRAGDEIR